MVQYQWISKGPDDTFNFAKSLGRLLRPQDVILLEGDLGAGKTTFTKGIAAGLGITRNVNSPTFTMIKEYDGRYPLYHMDVYRILDPLEDLGLDEYFYGDGVTVVEWAQNIQEQLPSESLTILLYYETDTTRKIIAKANGSRYEALCKEIFHEYTSD